MKDEQTSTSDTSSAAGLERTDWQTLYLEERRLREKAQAQYQHLHAIVAGLGDGLVMFDTNLRFSYANEYTLRLMGRTEEEAIGQPFFTLYPEAKNTPFGLGLMTALRERRNVEADTFRSQSGKWWRSFIYPTEGGVTVYYRDVTQLKMAEEQQQRLAAIVTSSEDAIVSKTLDGVITSWNEAAERIFGYKTEEVVGEPDTILFSSDRLDGEAILQHVRRGESIDYIESVRVRKDGKPIDLSLTISPIRDMSGTIIGVSTIARDISQKKHYEREREYVMTGARCLLWHADIYDGGEEYLWWQMYIPDEDAAQRFLPLDLQEGEHYMDAWYRCRVPQDREACDRYGTASVRAGESYAQEFRCTCADGSVRWIHEDVHVETVEPGKWYRAVAVCTDVTERVKSEEALRESEQRLRAALQAGKMGIWEWDILTDTLIWSEETERLFGLEPGTFEGNYEAYQNFLHPEDRETIRENVDRALQNKTSFEHEHRILLRDGSVRWVRGRGGAIYNEQGQPVRVSGIVTDITDQKRLEQQFLQAQKIEGIGRLAGGIAHDFNNLLSVILGYAEMVEIELPEDSDLLPNVQNIQSAATRAAKLTAQLLAFARKQVSEVKILDPNDLIRNMGQILKPLIREDIELVTLLKADAGNIKADPNQIEQVIVNLVVNARDAMPGSGKILIQTENVVLADQYLREQTAITPGEYVLIAVSDTGTGMTQEVKNQLFEPFFTTKEVGKGTGLGLATVYGIVKQSSGHIFVYSEVGVGTTVKVYLPRIDAIGSTGKGETTTDVSLQGSETVLVVEDERLVRELTVSILRRNGYTVLQAEKGTEALSVAAEYAGQIHLVVTDAIMPEMGGKELAGRLQTVRPSTRVLYVSGYTEEVTLVQGILPEGTAFLQKPFTAQGLLTKVREVLNPIEENRQ